jgi:hypothetical protein
VNATTIGSQFLEEMKAALHHLSEVGDCMGQYSDSHYTKGARREFSSCMTHYEVEGNGKPPSFYSIVTQP